MDVLVELDELADLDIDGQKMGRQSTIQDEQLDEQQKNLPANLKFKHFQAFHIQRIQLQSVVPWSV